MIVVFGSLNADFFLQIENFPKPGETVLTPSCIVKAGGKGANQAVAAAKAGSLVKMVGAVGKDEIAQVPMTALKSFGVDCSCIKSSDLSTGMATIMVDSKGENSIVVASGANTTLCASDVPERFLEQDATLILQMEVPVVENFNLLKIAKEKGMRTILNVAPAQDISAYDLTDIDYLIVNELEAFSIYNSLSSQKTQSIDEVATFLTKKTNGACLVTLGAKGVLFAQKEEITSVSSLKITPLDTTGAGDAFVGIFAAMLDQGLDPIDAVKRASAGAGLACLKLGAQEALPTLKEIETKIQEIQNI